MGTARRYRNRWKALSFALKIRFLRAAIVLIFIKTGLFLLPFSTFRKVFRWFSSTGFQHEYDRQEIDEIVWSVETAANILPISLLCLPRALAAKYLLRKAASLTLEIGIEINPKNGFEAHAWVEKEGTVIIGDWSDSVSYQRIWVWQ